MFGGPRVDLSRCPRADPERLPPIAMMTLYCDESDDGHTYALAGWLAVPSAWDTFDPAWRAMLQTIAMPDGSACRAFHATLRKSLHRADWFVGWHVRLKPDTTVDTRASAGRGSGPLDLACTDVRRQTRPQTVLRTTPRIRRCSFGSALGRDDCWLSCGSPQAACGSSARALEDGFAMPAVPGPRARSAEACGTTRSAEAFALPALTVRLVVAPLNDWSEGGRRDTTYDQGSP